MRRRIQTGLLAVLMALGALALPAAPAAASNRSKEKAWRIGTYIAGAGTIAALAKGKGTWALVGGGATLLSYSQWRKYARRRRQREDRAAYQRYRSDWLRRHRGRRIVRR